MALYDEKLKAIADQLKKGVSPQPENVRAFLAWFGAERRGYRVINHIRRTLDRYKVSTSPDFEYAYIDADAGQGLLAIACDDRHTGG